MPTLPDVAFKEWASVCQALATGRQSIILRKGGIAEAGGEFRPEYENFWLYPTNFHQQDTGLAPDARDLLPAALAELPPVGRVRLSHCLRVERVWFLDNEDKALSLHGFHVWSEETIRMRFRYRKPGLYLLAVRASRIIPTWEIAEHPSYAGCKSWVPLEETPPQDYDWEWAVSDERFAETMAELQSQLGNNG